MKRDDDYLRELLLEFEAQDDWLILITEFLGMNADERRKQYHVLLLADAGLVLPVGKSTYRLTASGHDFLDSVRDQGIWRNTKAAVAETGGSAALEITKALAMGFAKKKLSQHTGIEL